MQFHLQSNNHTERANQELKTAFHCITASNPSFWSSYIHWVEYTHNSVSSSAAECHHLKSHWESIHFCLQPRRGKRLCPPSSIIGVAVDTSGHRPRQFSSIPWMKIAAWLIAKRSQLNNISLGKWFCYSSETWCLHSRKQVPRHIINPSTVHHKLLRSVRIHTNFHFL